MTAPRDPLPIRLVAHHVFCPRRAWLEAMGEQTDTYQMACGIAAHRASDDPTRSRPDSVRAMDVSSEELGITGRCDTVEFAADGTATVVEYKSTPVRKRPHVSEQMVVQLALQAAALRESGVDVTGAAVYFTDHNQRVPVPIGEAETASAAEHVRQLRDLLERGTTPEPLIDDPRCRGCSHAGVCLPDERALEPVVRRVLVADPDTQVLYVATPGARVSIRSGRIHVVKGDDKLGTVPIERVFALVLHGNIDVSSGLLRELLWRRVPIVWCSGTERVIGWASSAHSPNGGARVHQHVASANGHLDLARAFITAKIANQATLLRRLGEAPDTVTALRRLQRETLKAPSIEDVYGVEDEAASRYFADFATMLNPAVRTDLAFTARTRRPATDPLNAALNFAYGLLLADLIRAVVSCGLDPHAGFLHSSGRNKPALALDLCEEFRAPVADSVVIGAFNNGGLKPSSFSMATGSAPLRDTARPAPNATYKRRMSTQFRHPILNYPAT